MIARNGILMFDAAIVFAGPQKEKSCRVRITRGLRVDLGLGLEQPEPDYGCAAASPGPDSGSPFRTRRGVSIYLAGQERAVAQLG